VLFCLSILLFNPRKMPTNKKKKLSRRNQKTGENDPRKSLPMEPVVHGGTTTADVVNAACATTTTTTGIQQEAQKLLEYENSGEQKLEPSISASSCHMLQSSSRINRCFRRTF
jgi:hypothetical protein